MTTHRPEVAMIVSHITLYREPFHRLLRQRLEASGITYTLVFGTPTGDVRRKGDWTTLDFAHLRNSIELRVGSKSLAWQPCYRLVRSADLVIVPQQSSRLINYVLWLRHLTGRQRLAFWGHGANMQAASASRTGETIKRVVSKRVHWWFAYNDAAVRTVRGLGFPADRITNAQNAIDTRLLRRELATTTDDDIARYRKVIGLTGSNVCVYLGAMYREKQLPFLVRACDLIREQVPDFEMVFVGSGSDAHVVEEAAAARPWMHHVGPRFGREKAECLRAAKLLLVPSAVGLVVLDAFAAEVPLVTIDDAQHGPEIDYLVDGENGRLLARGRSSEQYAAAVVDLLRDDAQRKHLMDGGRRASQRYTLEAMVERFADGVERALAR